MVIQSSCVIPKWQKNSHVPLTAQPSCEIHEWYRSYHVTLTVQCIQNHWMTWQPNYHKTFTNCIKIVMCHWQHNRPVTFKNYIKVIMWHWQHKHHVSFTNDSTSIPRYSNGLKHLLGNVSDFLKKTGWRKTEFGVSLLATINIVKSRATNNQALPPNEAETCAFITRRATISLPDLLASFPS